MQIEKLALVKVNMLLLTETIYYLPQSALAYLGVKGQNPFMGAQLPHPQPKIYIGFLYPLCVNALNISTKKFWV